MRSKCNKRGIIIEDPGNILAGMTTVICTTTLFHNIEMMILSFHCFFIAIAALFPKLFDLFSNPKLHEIYHLYHVLLVPIYALKLNIRGLNIGV